MVSGHIQPGMRSEHIQRFTAKPRRTDTRAPEPFPSTIGLNWWLRNLSKYISKSTIWLMVDEETDTSFFVSAYVVWVEWIFFRLSEGNWSTSRSQHVGFGICEYLTRISRNSPAYNKLHFSWSLFRTLFTCVHRSHNYLGENTIVVLHALLGSIRFHGSSIPTIIWQ